MEDVFIAKIFIEKVRHLENIEIPMNDSQKKHLIITGKNGSGKTSLLLAIKDFLQSIPDNLFCKISSIKYKNRISDMNFLAEIDKYYTGIQLSFNRESPIQLQGMFDSGLFIIVFFDAKRLIKIDIPKGISKIDLKPKYDIDERANQDFIQYIVNLKADQAFAKDENDIESVGQIDEWFELFEKSLREIFEDNNLKLVFDRKNYNFHIVQSGREKFDFSTLSDGYSAIFSIVTELILRMEQNKQKSYDISGIVLIDEIETHLHVELQKKILPFLTNFFPKIQFIVTTHSPFILNSLSDAVIYDLENRILVEDLSGYSYDGLIEGYFNVDKYSDHIKKRVETYQSLIEKDSLSESEREQLIELKNYLKKIPSDLVPELAYRFSELELLRKSKEKK